ncbi:hypothetical protein PLEOSDRAFT_1110057 [Pleurotus ostreatus PC15]|uniref:Uncharacterized protein n=1 Tax=Pleurotus ostreatus (strain PC15) TaxID=1137138 RepID=A0A067N4M4_PLEO1|nr:hypothetical protein PLEOSDRAFT_1110057 [Pleurotus ostreatus PC15]
MKERELCAYEVHVLKIAGLSIGMVQALYITTGLKVVASSVFHSSVDPDKCMKTQLGGLLAPRRSLLYMKKDSPKMLHLTPYPPEQLYPEDCIAIEHSKDGNKYRVELVTGEEACGIASRARYNGRDEARIAVTHTLSFGTSTVWFRVDRIQWYGSRPGFDVSVCLEFANAEDCTRFIQEDMDTLERKLVVKSDEDTVIDDIFRTFVPIADDFDSARKAVRRSLPVSQFLDEWSQPETILIHHPASNRGHGRPCYLTLHISASFVLSFPSINRVDWSATNIPPTLPSCSSAFRSLNNIHLKVPSPVLQDRNCNSSSPSHQDDPTITISAREISFSTGANSVSLGNGFTMSSEHRTVTVNYINTIMGDTFLGPITRSNIGGTNNVNTSAPYCPIVTISSFMANLFHI